MNKILITGGAGFIGSAIVRQFLDETDVTVINMDCLTYAGNLESLTGLFSHPRHVFEQVDIYHAEEVARVFSRYEPDAVMHLAAESHVDRSIDGPAVFIRTNIDGTYNLLETARAHWQTLSTDRKAAFRFHHISTDEVYGSLGETGSFTEESPYRPNSPYAASKAASDHLVRAWHKTYGLPVILTNCSNNYGPYQFPEKLIPLMILNCLQGSPLPIYGKGDNVRDWLHVDDHARALRLVLARGRVGESYNISGHSERTNWQVVQAICSLLDELRPDSPHVPHSKLIPFVKDRPGHDQRYAVDASKIERELGWKPKETFESGLRKTVLWYLTNTQWVFNVTSGAYRDWMSRQYGL